MFRTASRIVSFRIRNPTSVSIGAYQLKWSISRLVKNFQNRYSVCFYSTANAESHEKPKLRPLGFSSKAFSELSKTKVVNQQLSDRNGLPLMITISEDAAKHLNEVMAADSKPSTALRISVESGGCHGFEYVFKLTDTSEYRPDDEDSLFIRDDAKVIMDKTSLEILRDSKVDYVHELIGSQFKVVDSPYLKNSCGCGSSFDIDYDKMDQEAKK